jgi:hypothetical protein
MKNYYLLSCLFFISFYTYSQCSFPVGSIQNGATQTVCVNSPLQSQNVTNARGNNFILLNVVQGFTYNFSVGDVFVSNAENLDVFNSSNVNIAFSSGTNGTSITNWVAPFTGQVKIVLSYDACNFTSVTGRTVTISLVSVGNTLDNQNAMGTNTWVGHAYNWIGTSPPPGGTSPANPSATFPFNPENYLGYYNINSESITESFGGDYSCFPVLSNGSVSSAVYTETYAFRYKMRSTRPAGCYIARFRGDDGIRLYVDNQLVFNEWKQQSPTEYFNVFIYLDGDAELVLDYYENGGQNVVEFSLATFDTSVNSISLIGSTPVCNNVAPGVLDGSTITYTGTTINPTISFQWQVSTDNVTFVNIAGATSENYTPPGTTTVGIRYFRRIIAAAANAASCNYASNVVSIVTTATLPPTQPVMIAPTNTNCDRFDANWNPVAGAVSYLLYVSTSSSFSTILPGYNGLNVGTATSHTITGLSYNVLYYYRIQVVSTCSSRFSNTASFIYLDRPATPSMTPISCDSFTVNWTPQVRADSYELDVSTVSSFATFLPGFHGLNVGNVTSYVLDNLPVSTPIYYRLRAISTACGESSNSNSNNNITAWNGTTWSNGVPNFNRYAVINGNYDMTTLPSFDACSIEVNNGFTLTVADGKNANVENIVRVNSTGLLRVLNNGSLVQISNDLVNVGNISVQRTTQLRLNDFVYWSSPVLNFPVSSVSPNTPLSTIYSWNTIVSNPNGGQGNWQRINENMVRGKGYAIRGPNGYNNGTPQNFTATFTGVPNNGVISYPIQRGSNIGAGSNGPNGVLRTVYDDNWNLVGNPYPSSIDALAFLTENTNIDGNIRIWTSTTLPSNTNSDPFYNNFQYNYTPNDYIVHNGTATTSGPGTFNGYIASGQSFMVMMDEGAAPATSSVVFNNSMRSKSHDNSQFYRNEQSTNEKNRIWLDLISNAPNGTVSRTVVGYVAGATEAKDRLFDAVTSYKMSQNFYSILEEDILCIQGKALPFLDTDMIPLGFKASLNGSYSIAIAAVDGVFENNQLVYLEDKLTNTIHNLSQNPYVFQSDSGIYNNRFVLRYNDSTLSNPSFDSNSLLIYTESDKIYINSGIESIVSYKIYDILGRVLVSESNLTSNQIISELEATNQALIVKVKLENNQIISKKIIH